MFRIDTRRTRLLSTMRKQCITTNMSTSFKIFCSGFARLCLWLKWNSSPFWMYLTTINLTSSVSGGECICIICSSKRWCYQLVSMSNRLLLLRPTKMNSRSRYNGGSVHTRARHAFGITMICAKSWMIVYKLGLVWQSWIRKWTNCKMHTRLMCSSNWSDYILKLRSRRKTLTSGSKHNRVKFSNNSNQR